MKRVDEPLPGALALEPPELFDIDDHHRVLAMQRDALRPFAARQAHEFAKPCFRILKAPSPLR